MTKTGDHSLLQEIREIIHTTGPMSVADYMTLCLGKPNQGYYMRQDPFGADGDFTTAPEISQFFGELIGIWFISVADQLDLTSPVRLTELGPGRGTLMRDILRTIKQVRPTLYDTLSVHLIEMSPTLKDRQASTLSDYNGPLFWHSALSELPESGSVLCIANEFFDALPIRQFAFQNGTWRERAIAITDDGQLQFGLKPVNLPTSQLPAGLPVPQNTDILELSPVSEAIAEQLAGRIHLNGGAGLIIDYGYLTAAFGDTFQALYQHQFVDPLKNPGQQDLTAHVNFCYIR